MSGSNDAYCRLSIVVDPPQLKMMTETAIMAGLLPIVWKHGTSSEIMCRISAPMVGGMISSSVLTLIVIPGIYAWGKGRRLE